MENNPTSKEHPKEDRDVYTCMRQNRLPALKK